MTRPRAFHFGVDVAAPDGTAVYATLTGKVRVREVENGRVAIFGAGGVTFSYWHIEPSVRDGQRVTAYHTVIGRIADGWGHVHFAERQGGLYVNPLRRGAMGPYVDGTCPSVTAVSIERDGVLVEPGAATGPVDIVAEASDRPVISAPPPWMDMPVTPALVEWRLVDPLGRPSIPWRIAHDVRRSLPRLSYDDVYAIGTVQNYSNRPGRYRFYLARDLDPAVLAPGSYTVEIAVSDTGGNRSDSTWPTVISR